jgi:hypothetical protein
MAGFRMFFDENPEKRRACGQGTQPHGSSHAGASEGKKNSSLSVLLPAASRQAPSSINAL